MVVDGTLHTPRLILRRWREEDAEPFAVMNADPVVAEFLLAPLSRAESDAFIARIEEHFDLHGFGLWALQARASGELVGFTGLSRPTFSTRFTPCVEVGWRLARAHWGLGYATEAGGAALAFGFERAGLDEIVSFTATGNRRSIAVMERLGMRRDPRDDFDHPRVPMGHPLRPHVLYRLAAPAS